MTIEEMRDEGFSTGFQIARGEAASNTLKRDNAARALSL
jgi:hypothetical protein